MADIYVDEVWLQQNGTTYHTANKKINLLMEKIGERIILRDLPGSAI